jgi:hypothetical protein
MHGASAIPFRELRGGVAASMLTGRTVEPDKGAATMPRPTELVERYVAMWNEEDPRARGAAVRELWAQDGAHVLQPPQEMLGEAARIGFINPVLEARGHDELEARVTRQFIDR